MGNARCFALFCGRSDLGNTPETGTRTRRWDILWWNFKYFRGGLNNFVGGVDL